MRHIKGLLIKAGICVVCIIISNTVWAQRYLSDYDSLFFLRDTLRPFMQRLENLHFSGYIQPQFQVAEAKGAPSFEGGNFSEYSNSRFMLRRARIKIDYLLPFKGTQQPQALFTFQIDATERGVAVRDMFGRVYFSEKQKLYVTTGLFARPFGYELNLSSAYRESPERGRMSQILMPSERDLGAMFSYEPKGKKHSPVKWDAGVFNGQGLSGTTDFDAYKDIISRITLKPMGFLKSYTLSGGLSLLYGGWQQATKYRYQMATVNGDALFVVDSNQNNIGSKAPRHYYGADVQLAKKMAWGKTELRAEYWQGKQPGTASTTANAGTLPQGPTYIRTFNGAFFYLLQNIINDKWEAIVKYDWYDPNTKIKGQQLGKGPNNATAGDVRFDTWGFGGIYYINTNVKVVLYYSRVRNEKTNLPDYTTDIKDNVFTCRLHMRF